MPEGGRRRPRVLVLNQYYWPGVEATAHLLSELCAALVRDFDVSVVTGMPSQPGAEAGTSVRDGVRIVRVASTAYDRRNLVPRAVNYFTYLARSLQAALTGPRPDVVLCMTDPPVAADVGLLVARRFGAPLVVISQDVFPEIAVELRRIEHPALIALLRVAIRFYLERADRIVAIGETMRLRLEEKGAPPDRLRVIPNWTNTDALVPTPRDNAWAREHGLVDRFVVMHSGNVGHAQDLDSLIRAGTFLRDLDRLAIVIIGTGARHAELVELARLLDVDQVRFLPYQPRENLSLSLAAADVHVVGLARGLAGYVVPSRFYGVLAVGRPVIVSADQESETARVARETDCGVVVAPGRPELLARQIRRAYDGELDLAGMGSRGRAYVVAEATGDVAFARYRALLGELTGGRP